MKKYTFLLILPFLLIMCNKKEQNNISEIKAPIVYDNNEIKRIYISGYCTWIYEFEIKKTENNYILSITKSDAGRTNGVTYDKILSNEEINNIYKFIIENEIENEIGERTSWASAHDFSGSIIININNETNENEIYSTQEFDNNLYKVLNYLNNLIENEQYYMPINGVAGYPAGRYGAERVRRYVQA